MILVFRNQLINMHIILIVQSGRTAVLDTRANSTLSENISFVFGSKFLQTMSPFTIKIPIPSLDYQGEHDHIGRIGGDSDVECVRDTVRISGYVSRAGTGVGRSDNDRQFLFCNGRPVDLPKITRTMNEVFISAVKYILDNIFQYVNERTNK